MFIAKVALSALLIQIWQSHQVSGAKAVLYKKGKGAKVGIVLLEQAVGGNVRLSGNVSTLSTGKHGFHIHEKSDLSNGCDSLGAHYNPFFQEHGAPTADKRHVGDLGNIEADQNGFAQIDITDHCVKLDGQYTVIGRSIVVHEGVDDLGLGGYTDSKTTGHAGARHSCGIIVP